jgi:hypothetical protein
MHSLISANLLAIGDVALSANEQPPASNWAQP